MKEKIPVGNTQRQETNTQHDQDNGRGPGLVGYVMWKSNTKLVTWVSLDIEIYLDLSLVSLYSSQITLYKSLYAY